MHADVCFLTRDAGYASELRSSFDGETIEVRQTEDLDVALRRIRCGCTSLMLIDEASLSDSMAQVIRRIRTSKCGDETLIVVLSPESQEIDRVVAFELGADDFVTRPVGLRELGLRLRAVLRRHPSLRDAPNVLHLGPLRIETRKEAVFYDGERLGLTSVEYRLLVYLASHPGEVQERRRLLEQVWRWCDEPAERTSASRTVDTHVKRLREKLGPAAEVIETIRGVGYRFRKAS